MERIGTYGDPSESELSILDNGYDAERVIVTVVALRPGEVGIGAFIATGERNLSSVRPDLPYLDDVANKKALEFFPVEEGWEGLQVAKGYNYGSRDANRKYISEDDMRSAVNLVKLQLAESLFKTTSK